MDDVKTIVANNILELRKSNNMTQLELAEKLNYSDKTISKWERAESTPDISILKEIASFFGVTLDYLVSEHTNEELKPAPRKGKYNLKAISYISECCSWLVALFAFVITTLILKEQKFQFLYFVYALPASLIVRLILNTIWFNIRHNYYIVSLLMWATLAAVHLTFLYFGIDAILVYFLGFIGQFIIVLWSFIRKSKTKK